MEGNLASLHSCYHRSGNARAYPGMCEQPKLAKLRLREKTEQCLSVLTALGRREVNNCYYGSVMSPCIPRATSAVCESQKTTITTSPLNHHSNRIGYEAHHSTKPKQSHLVRMTHFTRRDDLCLTGTPVDQ